MQDFAAWIENFKTAIGVAAAAFLGALGLWSRSKRTHAEVSKDELTIKEAQSKAEWIDRQDAAWAQEHRLRLAAEARCQALFTELQEAKSRLRESDAGFQSRGRRIHRLEARCNYLIRLHVERHPELQYMVTEPAPLDD